MSSGFRFQALIPHTIAINISEFPQKNKACAKCSRQTENDLHYPHKLYLRLDFIKYHLKGNRRARKRKALEIICALQN